MTVLRILDPGLQTTVQDRGRFGWEHLGVAQGGALDFEAYRWAGRLALNTGDLAVLENVLTGLSFVPSRDVWISTTGAREVHVDGISRPPWSGFFVRSGARVEVRSLSGARCYVASHGGVDVEPVLGSRSTNLTGGFGGWCGRPLQAGDDLPIGSPSEPFPAAGTITRAVPVGHASRCSLRLVSWPVRGALPDRALETLLAGEYTVSPQSNEMGVRLNGPPVGGASGDIHSQPMPVGAIQIPPSGQPIVLLAGRGTLGGYPLIGTVVSPDLWRLAQARPGDRVGFSSVSLEEARSSTVHVLQRLETATPAIERTVEERGG